MPFVRPLIFSLAVSVAAAAPAFAQNVGDVSTPDVETTGSHVSWRTGFRPESDGRAQALAQRLHVQWSLDGRTHLRIGGLFNAAGGGPLDFTSAFAEVMFQTHEHESAGFDSAFRFDATFGEDGRATSRARATWLAQAPLGDAGWQVRSNLFVSRPFGWRARDEWPIGAGLLVHGPLVGRHRIGVEATDDRFNRVAQTGLVVNGPIARGWTYSAAGLAGASDRAAPFEARLFVNRSF